MKEKSPDLRDHLVLQEFFREGPCRLTIVPGDRECPEFPEEQELFLFIFAFMDRFLEFPTGHDCVKKTGRHFRERTVF